MKHFIRLFIAFLLFSTAGFSQSDNQYIYHTVQPKETLYSLVKKYNTNFATVENLNPELTPGSPDIKIGQVLKFPKTNTVVSEKSTNTKTHIVKPKETVFSISKLYDLDISNFVEVNKIEGNYIRIGDELIVDQNLLNREAAKVERPEELLLENKGRHVFETGMASIIYNRMSNNQYLAMHRLAPINSHIKVTNEATGHTIVARVIGRLNEKGPDEHILVKLSSAAYYQLRPRDEQLRARVQYFLPQS